MKVYQILKSDLQENKWDGGSTFEYFIYPKGAIYTNRNFLFRISHATITKTPSSFTKFEGFLRYLVMLDNHLEISHNNMNEKYNPFEIFTFDSNDTINSFSQGNDFNLMLSDEVEDSEIQIVFDYGVSDKTWVLFYAIEDSELIVNHTKYELSPYDCLIVENGSRQQINFKTNKKIINAAFLIQE